MVTDPGKFLLVRGYGLQLLRRYLGDHVECEDTGPCLWVADVCSASLLVDVAERCAVLRGPYRKRLHEGD